MNLVKVYSSAIDAGKRVVKILRYGRSDVRTAVQVGLPGIDSAPIENLIAVYSKTGKEGSQIILGYINKKAIAESGEIRFYSQDDDGNEQTYIFVKKDGTIELGGDSDNAVRFSELESGFNELKSDYNDLVSKFNQHIHTNGAGPTAGPQDPSQIPIIIPPTTADISDSKIENVKTS